MTKGLARDSKPKALVLVLALLAVCLLIVFITGCSQKPVRPQKTFTAAPASDNFNRAAGSLGADWTAIRDGRLSISSQAVIGRSGLAGDIWTARTFTNDQYSQIEVTSKQLTGSQWIGAAVRVQAGGLDGYVGVYYWNRGRPELLLFKRSRGTWTQLGNGYSSGPLAAGTQLKLVADGSAIVFLENGIQRLTVTDSSFSGGAPGIMVYGPGTAGNWSGGDASINVGFQAYYSSTDAHGVRSYLVISPDNGPGAQMMRILVPMHPAAGVPHNFLYVLPVQPATVTLSVTGWIRCAGSMRRTSTI